MVEAMQHRGYKNIGFFTDDYVVLAHNGSKLSSKQNPTKQPLFSNCKRYVIVYSGEIYNCAELAKKYNLKLTSNNDAEVVLELFVKNRTDFVLELNGAFAFAIYDRTENELYIYRDRLGIKPLYYIQNFDSFAFGSELKSLITIPKVRENLNIDNNAIGYYFHLGYIPSPHTIYQNIYKLEQGSMLRFSFSGTPI
jgi:asparagine synthase (glutamine-hydrolysing)